jgi:transcription termination factor NusB
MNKLIIENFFENKEKNWGKEYLINANDRVIINNKSYIFTIYFNLIIKKKENDLIVTIQLYAWSNDKQKYVPLKQVEDYKTKYICLIKEYYEPIIDKFLEGLRKYLKNKCYLKEFIHTIENPLVKYHYKLLNTFTKKELDKIRVTFRNIPRLNICEFYKKDEVKFPYIFKVDYCNGFYSNRIEVSVDLDDSDYAKIEDLSFDNYRILSKEEALRRLLDE